MSDEVVVNIPDFGSEFGEVIEILVKVGDRIALEQELIVLETDKASVEVPSSQAGIVKKIHCKVGDEVASGALCMTLTNDDLAPQGGELSETQKEKHTEKDKIAQQTLINEQATSKDVATSQLEKEPVEKLTSVVKNETISTVLSQDVHAGPVVRQLARNLGVDLTQVVGTGPRLRILKQDLHDYVKQQLLTPASPQGVGGAKPVAVVDFAKFGEVSYLKMSKIQRVTATNMLNAWLNVPHVTQFDNADVTEIEACRISLKKLGKKITPLSFLVKAVVFSLLENPNFNCSIDSTGTQLVQRHYINIGVAVATPRGLVVPVIVDADKKSLLEIVEEVAELAQIARDGKLKPEQMQGSCFTISSLGHIGGLGFTPIVNSPEVGILGVARTTVMPIWDGEQFIPRTCLPLSLSYDHRVINGADAGKFFADIIDTLKDAENFRI